MCCAAEGGRGESARCERDGGRRQGRRGAVAVIQLSDLVFVAGGQRNGYIKKFPRPANALAFLKDSETYIRMNSRS